MAGVRSSEIAALVEGHAELLASSLAGCRNNWHSAVREAVRGLYYCALHAANMLLASKGIETQSHSGTQTMLALHFVRAGVLGKDLPANLAMLEGAREIADYKGLIAVDRNTLSDAWRRARPLVEEALALVAAECPEAQTESAKEAFALLKSCVENPPS